VSAQTPEPKIAEPLQNDRDPTRAVLFSVRPEFSWLDTDVNRAALIFRYDYAARRQRRWLAGKRGVILRFEMPLAQTDIGASAETGLGDAQLLGAPYFTSKSSSAAAWVCRRQRAICVTRPFIAHRRCAILGARRIRRREQTGSATNERASSQACGTDREWAMKNDLTRYFDGVLVMVSVGLVAGAMAAGPMFTSTWRSPAAKGASFTGKKVAALIISSDDNLRISGEEQLARELTALGMSGLPAYRIMPKEELRSAERARPWFERAGIDGIVSLRPVSKDTIRDEGPTVWTQPNYSTLWGYYGYGWTTVYVFGGAREETTLVVETLVHSVPKNTLLWAGVSTTTNPKGAQQFITELVAATVKELKNERLAK